MAEQVDITQSVPIGSEALPVGDAMVGAFQTPPQQTLGLPDSPGSYIAVIERLGPYLHALRVRTKDRRILVALPLSEGNAQEVARVLADPTWAPLFISRSLRICLIEPNQTLDPHQFRTAFRQTPEDETEATQLIVTDPNNQALQSISSQFKALHRHYLIETATRKGGLETATLEDTICGFQNLLENLDTLFLAPDCRNWAGLLKGHPAVVVGAGPSIELRLEWLKTIQDRALIICADTMLLPLGNHGITPDLVVSIERNPIVETLLTYDATVTKTVLVAAPVLAPSALQAFKGPRMLFLPNYPYISWFPLRRVTLAPGHSCVGLALELAGALGCSDIFLAGIDLCWTADGLSHSPRIPYKENPDFKKNYKTLSESAIEVENVAGETVRTHPFWLLFRREFENHLNHFPGSAYNLSPFGLPINDSVAGTVALDKANALSARAPYAYRDQLTKALPYDRSREALQELLALQDRLFLASRELFAIEKRFDPSAPVSDWISDLKRTRCFESLYRHLFARPIKIFESSRGELSAEGLTELQQTIKSLPPQLERIARSLEQLAQQAKSGTQQIY